MHNILVVEQSKTLRYLLKEELESKQQFTVVECSSEEEAREELTKRTFLASIVSLGTVGGLESDTINSVINKKIPLIIFTSTYDTSLEEIIWKKPIVDYVLKDNPENLKFIHQNVIRLLNNPAHKVMVVDDSASARKISSQLLKNHLYQVFEAQNGSEALELLKQHPDIKLALVDYVMPDMDGLTLISKIREVHPKEDLAIIGLTSSNSRHTSAQFIKYGANDFIMKPYLIDEYYCRVNQNIETICNMQQIKYISDTDALTGLYNRRYLFRESVKLFATQQNNVAIAMFDIDSFKSINDTYGHLAGDEAIKFLADAIKERFQGDEIVCRFGGDELCIFFPDISQNTPFIPLELLRQDIEKAIIRSDDMTFSITVSIGVCCKKKENVEQMILHADTMLLEAKKHGKNVVIVDNELDS